MFEPRRQQLTDAIARLVGECGGERGALVDEGNGLWCAVPSDPASAALADLFYRAEIAPRAREMQRGHRLSVYRANAAEKYAAESFASLYVVVIWFTAEFDVFGVHKRIAQALPNIEAIVLGMPPFDGPGPGEVAQKLRG